MKPSNTHNYFTLNQKLRIKELGYTSQALFQFPFISSVPNNNDRPIRSLSLKNTSSNRVKTNPLPGASETSIISLTHLFLIVLIKIMSYASLLRHTLSSVGSAQ